MPGIVATLAAKRALFLQSGAAAVDLESGAVTSHDLPFAVLRAICDPATDALPPAALVSLTSGGGIDVAGVAASIARHPGQIGALIRLAGYANAARGTLKRAAARPGPSLVD